MKFQTLFHSQFSEAEIESARESVACEIEMFKMGADQEPIVTDLVHAAAYNNNTGRWTTLIFKSSRIDSISYYILFKCGELGIHF